MVTKKITTKEAVKKTPVKTVKTKESKIAKESSELSGKYLYAVGKRKSSIAQVRLYPVDATSKDIIVNGKNIKTYFTIERYTDVVKAPLVVAGLDGKFEISIKVVGGGIMGQSEAARLGVAIALVIFDENLKKSLKDNGYLTRDARVVERKKPGKRKARRSPQWAKR